MSWRNQIAQKTRIIHSTGNRLIQSLYWEIRWIFRSQGFPHSSVGKESACNAEDPGSMPGLGTWRWERNRLPTLVFLGFPCGSAGKESTCNVEDLGSIPGLGRSPGEGKGSPLQYSGLENSMDCIVLGVIKSRTQLSDFHFHYSNWCKVVWFLFL